MDRMYIFYFLLGMLLFTGAKWCRKGEWNEDYTGLKQTKILLGITALFISFHHMSQKSGAPWHAAKYIVHGLDVFVPMGFMFVGLFLFCSGLGLYKSVKTKPGYLDRGFFRRRILPIIVAYYLCSWLYLGLRLYMGQKMSTSDILWYISGLRMANTNAWYVVIMPFFYAVFWAAFRFCKKDGWAISLVFLFTFAYTVFCSFIDHQRVWWIHGEWWYNSILLFPLGILFGRFETGITKFFKKVYWPLLIIAFVGIFACYRQAQFVNNNLAGYYGQNWGDPLKVPHRLMSCAGEWMTAVMYTLFCILLTMKLRLGNRLLAVMGGVTLEYYLVHGAFVELFGYDFLEITKSIKYIRDVPTYIVVVLACSAVATVAFHYLWKGVMRLINGKPKQITQ